MVFSLSQTALLSAALCASLFLGGCATASSKEAGRALEIQSYTAGAAGFHVSSYLVAGEKEAILVDAQFTRSEAAALSALVRKSGKRLKTIFVTHGHPDHYFGAEVLRRDFPDAAFVASAAVVAQINATGAAKLSYWKPIYLEDLTDEVSIPRTVAEDDLTLDGERLQLIPLAAGESEASSALFVRSLGALIAGDAVYNNVHLWLAEGRAQAWSDTLATLAQEHTLTRVYAGHGGEGSVELLNDNRTYISTFVDAVASADMETAKKAVLAKYGAYRLPVILDLSLDAVLKR